VKFNHRRYFHAYLAARPFSRFRDPCAIQLAIEYEIEMLSVTYGPRLIERCAGLLGEEVLEGLSFLRDHVALDAGHTNFNRNQLSRLLNEQPGVLSGLVTAGSEALDAYATFLGDCVELLPVAS
jgi:hypothetical protein